jgi:hypothetical protein
MFLPVVVREACLLSRPETPGLLVRTCWLSKEALWQILNNSDRLHVSTVVSTDVRDSFQCRDCNNTGNYRHFSIGTYDVD